MTWLTALTAWPAPIGPTWVIVRPIAARTGRACSTSAASPPTKIVRVALRAPSLPPETGASTIRRPRSARRAAKSQLPDGAMVEQSTMSVPAAAPSTTPPAPNRTASTSGVSETQMTAMSTPATASDGLSANVTPRSASSGARPGVRFQPTTSNPPRARLAAIAAPIVPRPRKATRPRTGDGSAVMAGAPRRSAVPLPRRASALSVVVGALGRAGCPGRSGCPCRRCHPGHARGR